MNAPQVQLPWANGGRRPVPSFYLAHGARNLVRVRDSHGATHSLTGDGLGNLLKRRPSLQLDRNREIVLVSCNTAAPAPDGTVIAQQVADITGRIVHAPWGSTTSDLEAAHHEGWRTFRPRPQHQQPNASLPRRTLPQSSRALPRPPTHPTGVRYHINSAANRNWRMPGTQLNPALGPSLTGPSRPLEAALKSAVLSQWVVSHGSVITGVDYRHHGDGRLIAPIGPPITEEFVLSHAPRLPHEVPQGTPGRPSPWGTTMPILVAAGSSAFGVAVTSRGGPRELSFTKFAEHVRSVIEHHSFPADAPVVLVMPYAAAGRLELPRILAAVTGRNVWAGDGPMALLHQGDRQAPTTWIVRHAPRVSPSVAGSSAGRTPTACPPNGPNRSA